MNKAYITYLVGIANSMGITVYTLGAFLYLALVALGEYETTKISFKGKVAQEHAGYFATLTLLQNLEAGMIPGCPAGQLHYCHTLSHSLNSFEPPPGSTGILMLPLYIPRRARRDCEDRGEDGCVRES